MSGPANYFARAGTLSAVATGRTAWRRLDNERGSIVALARRSGGPDDQRNSDQRHVSVRDAVMGQLARLISHHDDRSGGALRFDAAM
jgi:hypothetical protein